MKQIILLVIVSHLAIGCSTMVFSTSKYELKLGDTKEYVLSLHGHPSMTELYYDEDGEGVEVYIYKNSYGTSMSDTHTTRYTRIHFKNGKLIEKRVEEDIKLRKEKKES